MFVCREKDGGGVIDEVSVFEVAMEFWTCVFGKVQFLILYFSMCTLLYTSSATGRGMLVYSHDNFKDFFFRLISVICNPNIGIYQIKILLTWKI